MRVVGYTEVGDSCELPGDNIVADVYKSNNELLINGNQSNSRYVVLFCIGWSTLSLETMGRKIIGDVVNA
jgi:hypothetical protein